MWENLTWRKLNWYRAIIEDLETKQHLSMGDKVLIRRSVDEVVDNYYQITGECPPTAPGTMLMVYDHLFPYGFKSPWVDRTMLEVRQIVEGYLSFKGVKLTQLNRSHRYF